MKEKKNVFLSRTAHGFETYRNLFIVQILNLLRILFYGAFYIFSSSFITYLIMKYILMILYFCSYTYDIFKIRVKYILKN